MKLELVSESSFIYLFCKKCWDYQKFLINSDQSIQNDKIGVFKCAKCDRQQQVNIDLIQKYYEVLNEHNN
ncbi:hypothetical protein [Spiroplasma endosymbiont of Panorpa germanica]|uniref:hypothetical protein n=1 Tax=Spiroplasma endosymbiont of Panorpa germanica TaxID=3066314 RepID=UPI0030D460B3